jgi:hypothetical protein
MPRSSVTATSGQQFFHRRCGDAHAEHRRAVAQPEEDRARIGAEFQRFVDAQERARTVSLLPHHQRVAINHIGAGIAVFFECHEFRVVTAQMRGAIENIADEGRPPQWKRIECCHEF